MKQVIAVLFLINIISCSSEESNSERSDAYAKLAGSWQLISDNGGMSNYYYYFDQYGNRRIFVYEDGASYFTEQTGIYNTYPKTEFVDNILRPYRLMSDGTIRYLTNGFYDISDDGETLASGGGLSGTRFYIKSDFELSYYISNLCG